MQENFEQILEKIRKEGIVKREYFPDLKFGQVRDLLEANGIDRHTTLELKSVEIALLTPFGVLMQIRPLDNDQLGLWGGVMEKGESPKKAAVRELFEETRIEISPDQLEEAGVDEHVHQYSNGDTAKFKSYRFIVRFDYVPKVKTDEESVGAVMVAHTIISHQQAFVAKCLSMLEES